MPFWWVFDASLVDLWCFSGWSLMLLWWFFDASLFSGGSLMLLWLVSDASLVVLRILGAQVQPFQALGFQLPF